MNEIDLLRISANSSARRTTALRALPAKLQRASGQRAWHRHRAGYAALVVEGGYVEIGTVGRVALEPGMAMLHAPFDAHANLFRASGARLVNLPIPANAEAGPVAVADPDLVVRLAKRCPREAGTALLEQARPVHRQAGDWPDLLASDIRALAPFSLTEWARQHGLAPETLSRGFRRCFGLSPREFRAEMRLRRAIAASFDPAARLCDIAVDAGYADQAHMTRAFRQGTGLTPAGLRKGARSTAW